MLARAVWKYWRSCAVEAWSRGVWGSTVPSTFFAPWSQISGADEEAKGGIWIDAASADLVVLDDVGSEVDQFKSGRPTENLRLMLEERATRRRGFTLITTNVLRKSWPERWDARIADRLIRNAHAVECVTERSYSQTKSQ